MINPDMVLKRILVALVLFCSSTSLFAQRIVYSEPEKDDSRRMDFEIIGKISGNILIYKKIRTKGYIAVYNNNMEQIGKEQQKYLPEDRLINVDFFAYQDFTYVVYEYQKKNVVYCEAAKIDGNGKEMADIVTLDTSHIGGSMNNKVYSAVTSEDKSKIMVFKINSRNKSKFVITTLLFDDKLVLDKRSRFMVPMDEHDDHLDQFNVDNDGDFVFTKFTQNNNETINATSLVWKKADSDSIVYIQVPQKDILLDEIHIKADNVFKRYALTSFYYKQKRGNIEGFYFYVWDKQTQAPVLEKTTVLGEELRKEAKGDANTKMAFNDYFIRNIIVKKDGGFLINAESFYTSSRYGNWNRWNYLYGMPYYSTYDYYSIYSPYYNTWWGRSRYDNSGNVRYHADNITVLNFDKDGNLVWSDVIHKEQFDDEGDDHISFQIANTGNALHYIFNMDEKRTLLLNDFVLTRDGTITHNPTLKNLDRGYEFLPKYAKQITSQQMIIPCFTKNYICFAKIDFN